MVDGDAGRSPDRRARTPAAAPARPGARCPPSRPARCRARRPARPPPGAATICAAARCGVGLLFAAARAARADAGRQLPAPPRSAPQLPAQVAQREVGEVEAALAGPGEVGGERGVAGEPRERPAAAAQRVQRGFDVVRGLRHGGIGEPLPQRRLVIRGERGDLDVARLRHARRCAGRPRLDRRLAGGKADAGEVGEAALPVTPWKASPTRRPSRACSSSHARSAPSGIAPPCTSMPPSASGSALCSVANSRSRRTRNSSSSKRRCTASRFHGRTTRSAGSASSGTSRTSSVSCRLSSTLARWARSASPALPFTSSTRSVSSASDPNSRTHFAAVFSPTPGMEGRLSEGSPRSAAKSGYCAGVSP